jgi:predicted small metal-binding protein
MKQFSCGDVVPGCTATFIGRDYEILEGVARHAAEAHGIASVPPELVTKVRSLMRPAA